MKINVENKFTVVYPDLTEKEEKLKDLLTDKNIIFFYPKDNTPWCTTENVDFSKYKDEFEKLGYNIIWVSKDSAKSHKNFIEKHKLQHILISDPDLILHKELGVWWEKKVCWKTCMWVIRSTFIVDKNWNVIEEFKNVKAKWHVEKLLEKLKENEN